MPTHQGKVHTSTRKVDLKGCTEAIKHLLRFKFNKFLITIIVPKSTEQKNQQNKQRIMSRLKEIFLNKHAHKMSVIM